ncbi:MAG TPA: tRNA glutamyl-Q(34) synthetase GluQRS [Thioalkalivibrio sp.]|nr:tRNA glutamyl-Q(34) synthetase GluQRS [Thioalkalivibrio sp.]
MTRHVAHPPAVIGRFAPSPTGPLHFGSLIAAIGSYLEARRQGGRWLVRMEDLDPPREVPGAADDILRTLEAYGLYWDGEVMYQSRRSAHYREILNTLLARGEAFECGCTRREIADAGREGPEGPVYPGTCREGLPPGRVARAIRLRTHDELIRFEDAVQGTVEQRLESEIGDFVVLRADGLFAYQLAVVVDDAEQGVTEVVRGADLLDSTPRQIHLQHVLGYPTPRYMHLPVAVNREGQKLSKQTYARPLDRRAPVAPLYRALTFLDQHPPAHLLDGCLSDLWGWALTHWDPARIPRVRSIHSVGD